MEVSVFVDRIGVAVGADVEAGVEIEVGAWAGEPITSRIVFEAVKYEVYIVSVYERVLVLVIVS